MKNFILISIFFSVSLNCFSQNSIDNILKSIDKNNIELQAEKIFFQSRGLEISTRSNLKNPEFDFINSFSKQDGKPYEISLSQEFDFPSSYAHKKRIIKEEKNNLQYIYDGKRQDIMLKAKIVCYELIYNLKKEKELSKRHSKAVELMSFFDKKLKNGDSNIIEVNKIKMVLLNTKNKLSLIKREISKLNKEIIKLNGGININTQALNYSQQEIIETNIKQEYLSKSPQVKALNNQLAISHKEILLAKANSLPKFSLGYRYMNSQISKASTGLQLGISIPLWAGKNTVKLARKKSLFSEKQNDKYFLDKNTEIDNLYTEYLQLKESKESYQSIFADSNIDKLLNKALKYGEISSIDYFNESIYFYNSIDTYLEIEFNYEICKALMLKYKL